MKKKILLIITLLLCFVGINKVSAIAFYDNLNVSAVFSENVDPFEIDKITISIALPSEEEKAIVLHRTNNFQETVKDIPKGNIEFLFGLVDDDRLAVYNVTGNIIKYPDNSSLDIKVVVDKKVNGTTAKVDLTQDQLNIINGGRIEKDDLKDKKIVVQKDGTLTYVDKSESGTKKTTSKVENTTNDIDDDDDDDIEVDNSTTRVIRESKKRTRTALVTEDTKRNNVIEKVLIFVAIGIVLTLLLFASVKILRANK